MSITIKDDIAFSTSSKAAYIIAQSNNPDAKKFTNPTERQLQTYPYAYWGTNNDLPIKMGQDIEECGVLNAALDAKARIAVGKGIQPFLLTNINADGKEELEYVDDAEISDFFDLNDSFGFSINSCYDLFGYGWTVQQLLLSRNRQKINRIKRTDVYEARLERKNKSTGLIDHVYLSADWSCFNSMDSEYVSKIPILEENAEIYDIGERTEYEFAILNRQLRNGHQYYPPPLWYSTKKWVDIAKSVPQMKKAMFNNQMTIKYLVTISQNYWRRIHTQWDIFTPEKRKTIQEDKLDEIDKYLTGSDNQYKSIFANSYVDPVTKTEVPDIKIDVLDDKVKDGKLLPDSAAANSEILFALMVNPALFGAGQPEGAYSNNAGGSNIRESYMVQLMLLEWERRQNSKSFNIVKRYNGWDKRLEVERSIVAVNAQNDPATPQKKIKPKLVFRYPSGLLTTLDTGKSTKPEVL